MRSNAGKDDAMKSKRILLIDDSQLVLDSIALTLAEEKHDLQLALSGEAGVDLIQARPFDLVVTDLEMDGINGIEVLKTVREVQPDIGVIILTGAGDMTTAIEALRLGADDYLLKPFDPDELTLRVNACLEKHELMKKVQLYENILPVCSYCKTIRDDSGTEFGQGKWMTLEEYLDKTSGVRISHGCCPACYEREMKKLR